MPTNLPFNLENIIYGKTVENARIEYKKCIDDQTKIAIEATICAFANDYYNVNGGWIIIGIDAPDGEPVLPPFGIESSEVENVQQELRVLSNKNEPSYHPSIFTAKFLEKNIVIAYIPAGDDRPYKAHDPRNPQIREYFIREGAETVKATKSSIEKLIEMSAKIPFDDRIMQTANISDIDQFLIKEFLAATKSKISPTTETAALFNALRIVGPYHDTVKPKNVGILLFTNEPHNLINGSVLSKIDLS